MVPEFRERDDEGKFAPKSSEERKVRSIRATDEVWLKFGDEAENRCITRADLLEQLVKTRAIAIATDSNQSAVDEATLNQVVELLQEALEVTPHNRSKPAKERIKRVLGLLGVVL